MNETGVLDRMRADWNDRAREDAKYYVAFGRRGQEDEEFFATAADVVRSLEAELRRLRCRERALEIGCGPGRLLRPMSRHFAEIHGVDVSDEMLRLAREKLGSAAQVHHTSGADLSMFPDEYFDFVYSYAVFQHIPSREVVFRYLEEARRVLKLGGILRAQINGLPQTAARYTTWHGVRISAAETAQFARDHDFQLLALDGIETQYMWTTWRKQPAGWRDGLRWSGPAVLRNISNAQSGESAVPASGPYASASLWLGSLSPDCDLNHVEVRFDGKPGRPSYLGSPAWDEVSQLNVALPDGIRTGVVPVEADWLGRQLCDPAWLRVIPPGPLVPRICSITDGVDLLSGTRVVNGCVKVTMEEVMAPESFEASLDGRPLRDPDVFRTDPLMRRYEINLALPAGTAPGAHTIEIRVGRRRFAPVGIEVA